MLRFHENLSRRGMRKFHDVSDSFEVGVIAFCLRCGPSTRHAADPRELASCLPYPTRGAFLQHWHPLRGRRRRLYGSKTIHIPLYIGK
jgi:hypothetical protein